jgi:hypothetical protein
MKKVKYEVTGAFGTRNEGDIIDAYLVAREEGTQKGLLFHPAAKGECASFEFAIKDGKVWISEATDDEGYINVSRKDQLPKCFQKIWRWPS